MIDKVRRFPFGPLENLLVANQVGDAKRRDAPLSRTKKFAWPAQFQINLCNPEPVSCIRESSQANLSVFRHHIARKQQTIRFAFAPPDTASKLVQLGKAKPF